MTLPFMPQDTVNFPVHLKNFNLSQLRQLCKELRSDIVHTVSKTGGAPPMPTQQLSSTSLLSQSILFAICSLRTLLFLCAGHLGASLGVVELTVALHYVFNTPDDKVSPARTGTLSHT